MYFRELKTTHTASYWYNIYRAAISFLLGLLILIAPETTLDILVLIAGLALILNAAIIALPLLLGTTTRRLWKIIVLREVVQIMLGSLLITNQAFGRDVLFFALGGLLLFRSVVEGILFVEARTTVTYRRGLLLTTLLFFGLSALIIGSIFTRSAVFIYLLSLFLMVDGVQMFVLRKLNPMKVLRFVQKSHPEPVSHLVLRGKGAG